ncbi:winged helix-turn-helix domain-containing protein [Streptomyces europaeiscabiei]
MQAAELFEQKSKPSEVAQRLRVSLKSAYQWHQLRRVGGREALTSHGPSGSRCRLSPRCLEKLAGYLEQGPAEHGWVEDQVWTAARVATLIGRKFHVSYSVSGATRLMHRLGIVTLTERGEMILWLIASGWDRPCRPRRRCTRGTGTRSRSSRTACGCTSGSRSASARSRSSCWSAASSCPTRPSAAGA